MSIFYSNENSISPYNQSYSLKGNVELLQEAGSLYVGKTKNLQEIEKILKSCENSSSGNLEWDKVEKVIPDIEKLFRREFNCDQFVICVNAAMANLNLIGSVLQPKMGNNFEVLTKNIFIRNAYTIPGILATFTTLDKKSIEPRSYIARSSEGGYRFISKDDCPLIFVEVFPAAIINLTAQEFIAVILHEVGHNFYFGNALQLSFSVVSGIVGTVYKYILSFVNKAISAITPNFLKSAINWLFKIIDKVNAISGVVRAVKFIRFFAAEMVYAIPNQTRELIIVSGLAGGYENEKFSDNFAAIYGYGHNLSSALSKFGSVTNSGNKKSESLDMLDAILCSPAVLLRITRFGNCHPGDYTRLKNMQDFMRNELSNEKDPRIKKEMKTAIQNFDILLDKKKYTLYSGALTTYPADLIKQAVSKLFQHSDAREVLGKVKTLSESTEFSSDILYSNYEELTLENLEESMRIEAGI